MTTLSQGFAVGLLLGVTGCAATTQGTSFATKLPDGSPAVHLEGDVAEGYHQYGAMLADWGEWSRDSLAGVHWCPRVDPSTFQPYRTAGHWAPLSPELASTYGAPRGVPLWVSESTAPWADVTLHHGHWTRPDEEDYGAWCWIPGATPTPAAVSWRIGDGFVGWAPEGVEGSPDVCDADDATWSYEFLAALFEDVLDSQLLTGDGATQAAQSTHPGRAPTRADVRSAKVELVSSMQGPSPRSGTPKPAAGPTTPTPHAPAHVPSEPTVAKASSTGGGTKVDLLENVSTDRASTDSTKSSTHLVVVTAVSDDDDLRLPPGMAVYRSFAAAPVGGAIPAAPPPYAWAQMGASPLQSASSTHLGSSAGSGYEGGGHEATSLHASGHSSSSSSSHSSSSSSSTSSHSSGGHHR
jgi:hypothetical protein